MAEPQTFRNHTRRDPLFAFVVMPVLLINVIVMIVLLAHGEADRLLLHVWLVILAVALLLLGFIVRGYATRVQDRLIRLEERLRYAQLLSPDAAMAANALSVKQIVALRFASDGDLPGLVQRAIAEHLEPKAIKQAITVWRPDTLRV